MKKTNSFHTYGFGTFTVLFGLCFAMTTQAQEEKVLNVYNWSDYIAEDTIANFTAETGIKVNYDVYDSNEVLEAKLLAGNTGYDLVFPTGEFLERQIAIGIYQPLNKDTLKNLGNMDAKLMASLANHDPGNTHALPYMWGTTAYGYNVAKVTEILGENAPTDSWDLIFKPENAAKLAECGLAFLDAPTEILASALHYLGLDPFSDNPDDYKKAEALLQEIRPHITYFHSSQYISDLANGEICAAIGWSGDVIQAADIAAEADKGVEIAYSIPKEGAMLWFDAVAIPKDAPHPENAHLFLDYLMRPKVIAAITDYVWYPNANSASFSFVDPEITSDPTIYPPAEVMARLYAAKNLPPKTARLVTRSFTRIKTGR